MTSLPLGPMEGSKSSCGRTGVDEPLSATVVETAATTTTAKLHDQYCVRYEGNSSKKVGWAGDTAGRRNPCNKAKC